ncbi:uncharacterized protein LOC121262095 [Juglans microcarpa x Juglans regia]|uniref:uncharacterized protein LOC121262095 n=1 Tax=Juglans microcarpa x Juglans regia TaxID=2249226 RepID=UPI001B7DFE23|nr:uncharacterized protein LOC121262095 [Juglans microcarpa x Juglans regia]
MKGVKQFDKNRKLSQRYVGPFQILEKIGTVAYRIALPDYFGEFHDVFHVSSLKKSFGQQEPLFFDPKSVQLQPNLTYEVVPTQIMDRKEQQLRSKTIPLVMHVCSPSYADLHIMDLVYEFHFWPWFASNVAMVVPAILFQQQSVKRELSEY